MKTMKYQFMAAIVATFCLAGTAHAAKTGEPVVTGGTHFCGGTDFRRQNILNAGVYETERSFTVHNFRNINATGTLTIERIAYYDATGALIFDLNAGNGYADPVHGGDATFNPVLGPRESTQLRSSRFFSKKYPNGMSTAERPFQMFAEWSIDGEGGMTPHVTVIRLTRGGGSSGEEKARAHLGCRLISTSTK